ncbi:nucleoid-associated protein [Streptomyces sp. P01-B04]|uniref:nucleoid-associated protein n=1 Tax=Streptomyces poriferorum TaxID=2798799 RepID=UPI001C5F7429|nr:nucleoid-associated protein [Streptomyces poriferorum]MBW5252391.1 nucleoid-associated protein [Streptomyces poriferorum]MBW5259280.1 nucleoid-associated protein [Streptomyces poriferorum]
MRSDFGDFVVKQAIVHVIPQRPRGEDPPALQLSQTACRFDDAVRTALQAKLREVLDRLGREVVEDPELKSVLPDAVRAYLAGELDLVAVSGELAHALRDSQNGSSSAGLLLVAAARLDHQHALLMVKLEQETGMQANEIVTDGLRTFDVQYFANLLFTEKSKVYKVALFSEEGNTEQTLQGWAADPQKSGKDVARFFLEKFLGCRHQDHPRELTRRFHDTAMDWVNSRVTDSEVRMDYVMAVMVELQSSAGTLDPVAFLETHLREPHRDDFANFLMENDVPIRAFDKDTDLVEGRLQKVRVDLANGAFLVAPLEAVQDGTVAVEDLGDGRTTVTVTSTLTKTSSGAAAGRPTKPQDQAEERPSQTEMIPGLESVALTVPARMPHARSGDEPLPAQT